MAPGNECQPRRRFQTDQHDCPPFRDWCKSANLGVEFSLAGACPREVLHCFDSVMAFPALRE